MTTTVSSQSTVYIIISSPQKARNTFCSRLKQESIIDSFGNSRRETVAPLGSWELASRSDHAGKTISRFDNNQTKEKKNVSQLPVGS